MIRAAVAAVLDCYPRVFFACHGAHVRDPGSKRTLSAQQAAVVDHLDTVETIFLHELARHLGVTPSSMSLMIDRLEKGGYVRRSRDTLDARRVNLRLTKAGARVKAQQKVLDTRLVEAVLRRLLPAERESVVSGLRTLARAANEMTAEHSRPGKKIG
jgi:DNA-binding MarR family transcriptional regulator